MFFEKVFRGNNTTINYTNSNASIKYNKLKRNYIKKGYRN